MNKKLGLALLLVSIGIVVFGIGFAIAGQNNTETDTMNNTYALADISRITVDTDLPSVVILPVSGSQVKTIWNTGKDVAYQVGLANRELNIRYYVDSNWIQSLLSLPIPENQFVLTIELPESYTGEITINTVSGSVSLQGPYTLQNVALQTESGSIDLSDIKSQQAMNITSVSGSVQANDISVALNLRMQNVSGAIQLKRASVLSDFNGQTTSGRIKVSALEAEAVTVHSQSGNVELSDVKGNTSVMVESISGAVKATDVICQTFTADSVSGSIDLQRLSAEEIAMHCISGSISGTVLGKQDEFNVIVNTVSGSSNLRSSVADTKKTLSMDTTSGSINVKFTGFNGE